MAYVPPRSAGVAVEEGVGWGWQLFPRSRKALESNRRRWDFERGILNELGVTHTHTLPLSLARSLAVCVQLSPDANEDHKTIL